MERGRWEGQNFQLNEVKRLEEKEVSDGGSREGAWRKRAGNRDFYTYW
jgi:hypothetical protein